MVRFKNRYIVCEYRFESESKNLVFSGAKLKQVLLNSIRQNYGDLGMGLVQASLAAGHCTRSPQCLADGVGFSDFRHDRRLS